MIDDLVIKILDIVFEDKIDDLFLGNIFDEKGFVNENYIYFCKITSLVEEIAVSKDKEDFKNYPKYFEEKIQNLQKLFNKYYSSNKNNLYTNIIDTLNKEIEKNYKMEKEKDLEERKHKKEDKLNKFSTNINFYKEEFTKLNQLKSDDKKNFEEINKVANNIKGIAFEPEEKKRIFSDKDDIIEIFVFKLDKPENVTKLELERKEIILPDYKQYFYTFSENHLHVSVKTKTSPQILSSRKDKIKYIDFEQADKIKDSYQNEMRKLVIDETMVKPILELNDKNINPDLESDLLFINLKNFFENFRKLINNLNEHIDNVNLLQGYKEDTEKLLKDIKEINMLRPRLKDFVLDEINRKCIEFGNFKDNVMKDLENLINTYNSFANIVNLTDQNKKIIPKEFNLIKLDDIKFSEKKIGFDSFDLNISTPYLSLSTDNRLQFCLKTYNQDIDYIIPALYHGESIKFNIISFVDKSVKSSLIFNEENLITKQISINQITNHNEPIIIKFEIPYDQALDEDKSDKISGKLNFELLEESGMSLQIPFNFNFEFIPLNVIFESNYGFFLSRNTLKYAFENSSMNLEIFLYFRFEKSNLSFDKWKNNYSIEKLEGNQIEEEPQLKYQKEEQKFIMTFTKDEKKLIDKKLNARIKFYITKNLTIPIQISTTFRDKQFVLASFNDAKNELDFEYFHIYLYEEVGEQIITFRVEYEDDSLHTIYLTDSGYSAWYGAYLYYFMGNIFKFSKGITFKIKFSFNKKQLFPDKLSSLKIFVKNEKGISKSLSIKLHIEESVSISKFLIKGISNFFFGQSVDERYWKIPHIGYNYTLKKYKFVESKEKMHDYIPDEKQLTVFYTPYKCVLVNRVNIKFFYYNNVVESGDYEIFDLMEMDYRENEPEIITVFKNDNDVNIWLPTVNYFGEINKKKTYYINIEEEEKSIELNNEFETLEDNIIDTNTKSEEDKKKQKKQKKDKKELAGEKIAKQNLKDLKDNIVKYFKNLKFLGKNSQEKNEYKKIVEKSNLVSFINYFSDEKIDFEKKTNYLSYIQKLMIDKNNKSAETLNYFINFEKNRYKNVKNMYLNNLIEILSF